MLTNNLRTLMSIKNIDTITELVEISGLSRNAINKLFRNDKIENMSLGTLISICDALNCNLSNLVEYSPQNNIVNEEISVYNYNNLNEIEKLKAQLSNMRILISSLSNEIMYLSNNREYPSSQLDLFSSYPTASEKPLSSPFKNEEELDKRFKVNKKDSQ